MNIWWDSLLPLGRFFYLIAIPSTLVLLIQFVMSLLGLSHDTDLDVQNLDGHVDFNLDHDFDISDGHEVFSADFQFISFRSIIAFLTMVVSVAAGLLAMFVIGYLFFLATKLQSSGNISYQNAVGSTAEVYIPINENTNFQGKVQVVVQERLIEASAITKNKKGFSTGEIVQVVGLVGLSTLVVDELSPEK
jgi:hypothetical protein